MKRIIMWVAGALIVLSTAGCNDELNVEREYDFSLSTWFLPERIAPNGVEEIRFTLGREKVWEGIRYGFCVTLRKGSGEVYDAAGHRFTSREVYPLEEVAGYRDGKFVLWYKNAGEKNASLDFTVTDNFGQRRSAEVEFRMDK